MQNRLNEKYRILQQLSVGICILDINLKIVFWNRILEQWTGNLRIKMVHGCLGTYYPRCNEKVFHERIKFLIEGGPPIVLS